MGALDEAAMLVARSDEPQTREEVAAALARLLDAMRA
jgi:Tetracyclin repressor-like, C-terminal domain